MSACVYDVLVEGELGAAMLRYLDCDHRVEPQRTVVRLDAVTAAELDGFLKACHDAGIEIAGVKSL